MDFIERMESSLLDQLKNQLDSEKNKNKEFEDLYFGYIAANLGINKNRIVKEFRDFVCNKFLIPTDFYDNNHISEDKKKEIFTIFDNGNLLGDELYKPTQIKYVTPIYYFLKEMVQKYVFSDFENYIKRVSVKDYKQEYTEFLNKKENIILYYVRSLLFLSDTDLIKKKYITNYLELINNHNEIIKSIDKDEELLKPFVDGECFFETETTNIYYTLCVALNTIDSKELIDLIIAPYKKTNPELIIYLETHDEIDVEKLFLTIITMNDIDFRYILTLESEFALNTIALYTILSNKKLVNFEKYVLLSSQYSTVMPILELTGKQLKPSYIKSASEYFDKEFLLFDNNGKLSNYCKKFYSLTSDTSVFKACTEPNYIRYNFLKYLSTFGIFLLNSANTSTADASRITQTYLFSESKEKTLENYKKIEKAYLKLILGLVHKMSSLELSFNITKYDAYMNNVHLWTKEIKEEEENEKKENELKEQIDKVKNERDQYYKDEIEEKNKKLQEQALLIERLTNENLKLKDMIEKGQHGIQDNELVNFEEVRTKEDKIAFEEMISFLQDYRIRYTGGHPVVLNKLKQIFPKWDFYESGKGFHWNENELFKKTDYCVIHYIRMSHSEFNKIMRGVENYDIPIIYVKNNNIESIISVVYNRIQEEIMKKESKTE